MPAVRWEQEPHSRATRGPYFGKKSESVSLLVVSSSLGPHGLSSSRSLCSWDSPGKNAGVGSRSLLQAIFPTQGWNPGLLHCRQILYCLNHPRSNRGAGSQREIFTVLRLAGEEIMQLGFEVMVGICQGFRGRGWVSDPSNRENSTCKAMEV